MNFIDGKENSLKDLFITTINKEYTKAYNTFNCMVSQMEMDYIGVQFAFIFVFVTNWPLSEIDKLEIENNIKKDTIFYYKDSLKKHYSTLFQVATTALQIDYINSNESIEEEKEILIEKKKEKPDENKKKSKNKKNEKKVKETRPIYEWK